MVKHLAQTGVLLLLLLLMTSCWAPSTKPARTGLDRTLAAYSSFEGMTLLQTQTTDRVSRVRTSSPKCIYAETQLYFGAPDEAEEVFLRVNQRLGADGWIANSEYPSTHVFTRGARETLVVKVFSSSDFIEEWEGTIWRWPEFESTAAQYRTVLVLRFTYAIPQREGC